MEPGFSRAAAISASSVWYGLSLATLKALGSRTRLAR